MKALLLSLVLSVARFNAQTVQADPVNPHYYDFQGKPTLLITSAEHYGAVINADFDYLKYFDALQKYGLNYTRIYPGYLFEPMGKFVTGNTLGAKPSALILPWSRSNQPGYLLSGNKFDLDHWNPAYFARLKDFIAQAAKRGIVVEICFFNGQYSDTWPLSPLYHENNIQGAGRGGFRDAQTLKDPELVAREDAYIRKIVTEVNGFDNVILEVCDEPALFTPLEEAGPWVAHMLETTYKAEAGLPNKHLIGQEVQGPVNGPVDLSSKPANSVIVTQYVWHTSDDEMGGMKGLTFEYLRNKPIEQNETEYYPLYSGDAVAASRVEAWEFMVGGGAGFNQLNGLYTVEDPAGNTPDNARLLGSLRNLKLFLESFDFVKTAPDRGFIVSGIDPDTSYRGLSEYGKQYALYIHHGEGGRGSVYLVKPGRYKEDLVANLPAGNYNAEWIDPASYAILASTSFKHPGGLRTLTTPTYEIDIALRIKRQ
ncbi:hypothetical protein ACPOL_7088 (plasmid) [Acidisarcina polymorpha]|uniref:Uncharacterized protein n=1 Tax=Acidisarcina polymorpha TaxID=2211140 RepID=A0A2Z5GBG7_9BACT|nr:hypothetical protein [Acidisarcina polymorpha]AXC16280.1 hypothetical protein ACPOL_7088 [Acidisarcina polymorpha]